MDQLLKSILGQPDPNNPLATPPMSGTELLLRGLAAIPPPPGQMQVPNTAGGRIGGIATRFGQGLAGAMAQDIGTRRADPTGRALALLEQGMTVPTALNAPPAAPVFGGSPIQEQTITGQPSAAPPLLPGTVTTPQARIVTPRQVLGLRAMGVTPSTESMGFESARQAAEREQAAAATQASQATTERQQFELEQARRQAARDQKFRERFTQFREARPNATELETARFAGRAHAEEGASEGAIRGLTTGLSLEAQITSDQERIKVNRDQLAISRDQLKLAEASGRRGDLNAARQIMATEAGGLRTLIGQAGERITALQGSTAFLLKPTDPRKKAVDKSIEEWQKIATETTGQLRDLLERVKSLEGRAQPPPPAGGRPGRYRMSDGTTREWDGRRWLNQ